MWPWVRRWPRELSHRPGSCRETFLACPMKTCKIYVAKPLIVLYLLMTLVWPLIGALGIALAVTGALGPDSTVLWVFVAVFGIGLAISYLWLRIPFQIRLNDSGFEFRSVVRRTVVPAAEIRFVKAKPYALGFADVRHARGTVHLISQMDGFHEFVATVKLMNPGVTIEGC